MRTLTATPATQVELLDDGTMLTVRPADRHDVARLVEMGDDVAWPILDLDPPPTDEVALPGADGETALLLVALDDVGRCLGLAGYDRTDASDVATLAVDLNPEAYGRGVVLALVRRLVGEAVRHGIRRLDGWLPPVEGRELVLAAPPPACRLLAVAAGRWHVVECAGEPVP